MMDTSSLYKNCASYYDKYHKAVEIEDVIIEIINDLEKELKSANGFFKNFLGKNARKINEINQKINNNQRARIAVSLDQDIFRLKHNRGAKAPKSNPNSTGQRGTFKNCVTKADVKKVYRTKAKKHHPDVGGDPEQFRILSVQYKRALGLASA